MAVYRLQEGVYTGLLRDVQLYEADPVEKMFLKLLGHRSSATVVDAPWVPYCDAPVMVHRAKRGGGRKMSLEVNLLAPCRMCEKCLRFRQMQWRERVLAELQASPRSWFQTLTFSETHMAGLRLEVIQRGFGPDVKPEVQLEAVAYSHLQKYVKRLRKAGSHFRYIAVWETGEKTGRGHYHLLMHEMGKPLSSRLLEDQWRSHSQPRVVRQERAGLASYLTKYLTKSIAVRPRASLHYGKQMGLAAYEGSAILSRMNGKESRTPKEKTPMQPSSSSLQAL